MREEACQYDRGETRTRVFVVSVVGDVGAVVPSVPCAVCVGPLRVSLDGGFWAIIHGVNGNVGVDVVLLLPQWQAARA